MGVGRWCRWPEIPHDFPAARLGAEMFHAYFQIYNGFTLTSFSHECSIHPTHVRSKSYHVVRRSPTPLIHPPHPHNGTYRPTDPPNQTRCSGYENQSTCSGCKRHRTCSGYAKQTTCSGYANQIPYTIDRSIF